MGFFSILVPALSLRYCIRRRISSKTPTPCHHFHPSVARKQTEQLFNPSLPRTTIIHIHTQSLSLAKPISIFSPIGELRRWEVFEVAFAGAMNGSRPSVHPVEAPPPATDAGAGENPLPRGRMKDIQGMPGTRGGLALRLSQFAFAVVALCIMASTSDFPSVTAFRYIQSLSLVLSVLGFSNFLVFELGFHILGCNWIYRCILWQPV